MSKDPLFPITPEGQIRKQLLNISPRCVNCKFAHEERKNLGTLVVSNEISLMVAQERYAELTGNCEGMIKLSKTNAPIEHGTPGLSIEEHLAEYGPVKTAEAVVDAFFQLLDRPYAYCPKKDSNF